jgi:hypothetical protein
VIVLKMISHLLLRLLLLCQLLHLRRVRAGPVAVMMTMVKMKVKMKVKAVMIQMTAAAPAPAAAAVMTMMTMTMRMRKTAANRVTARFQMVLPPLLKLPCQLLHLLRVRPGPAAATTLMTAAAPAAAAAAVMMTMMKKTNKKAALRVAKRQMMLLLLLLRLLCPHPLHLQPCTSPVSACAAIVGFCCYLCRSLRAIHCMHPAATNQQRLTTTHA